MHHGSKVTKGSIMAIAVGVEPGRRLATRDTAERPSPVLDMLRLDHFAQAALATIVLVVLMAVLAPVLPIPSPTATSFGERLLAPALSWAPSRHRSAWSGCPVSHHLGRPGVARHWRAGRGHRRQRRLPDRFGRGLFRRQRRYRHHAPDRRHARLPVYPAGHRPRRGARTRSD